MKLKKNHLFYCYKVITGSSYRADLGSLLDRDTSISAYALRKKADCSYRTAYIAKEDCELLKRSGSKEL